MILFSAHGPGYGTGHRVRMDELHSLLVEGGEGCIHLTFLQEELQRANPVELLARAGNLAGQTLVMDLRDMDPVPFLHIFRRVVALDNRNPIRQKVGGRYDSLYFYDTLPHGEADRDDFLSNFLLSRFYLDPITDLPRSNQILLYTGPFPLKGRGAGAIPEGWELLLVGERLVKGDWPAGARIENRMDPASFARAMGQSSMVITYPGQTLLEAWALEKIPVILPVESGDHRSIGEFLSSRFPISTLDPDRWNREGGEYLRRLHSQSQLPPIATDGYDRLIAFLRLL